MRVGEGDGAIKRAAPEFDGADGGGADRGTREKGISVECFHVAFDLAAAAAPRAVCDVHFADIGLRQRADSKFINLEDGQEIATAHGEITDALRRAEEAVECP